MVMFKPARVAALTMSLAPLLCAAQVSDDVVRIGFLTDFSGVYADIDGKGGAEAIRMAIAQAGGSVLGKTIELLVADHQNKADIAAGKAREWFDTRQVDMLVGGTNSGANLAMARVAAEKKKVFLSVGAGSTRLTNEDCSPYTIHYAFDTMALARGTAAAIALKSRVRWFFVTVDYAYGTQMQKDASAVIEAAGGQVAGSVKFPLAVPDMSSYLLQANGSGAQILGLITAGSDTVNAIRTAHAFGVSKTMTLAGMSVFITDIHALGLAPTQGMLVTDGWYWDQSAESRAWAKRYFARMKRMPTMLQAGDYSAVHQYLQAVKAVRSDNADAVLAHLRQARLDDMFVKNGTIRPDGRMVHDMFLFRVKAPSASTGPWDYYELLETIPGDQAFTTRAESRCASWNLPPA